jgi:hypothetical protein
MKHNIYTLIIGSIVFLAWAGPVEARELSIAAASASPHLAIFKADERVAKLQAFLETYDSPLAESAQHFISEADRLHLDWKLVPAIAGVESTFGKHIPTNSYNGYGWGVFTGQNDGIHFKDWNDGITKVSEGLRYNYLDKGAQTIEQIGHIYAASPAWSWKVRYFIQKIEDFETSSVESLAVTI